MSRIFLPAVMLFSALVSSGVCTAIDDSESSRTEVTLFYGVRAYNHGDLQEALRLFRQVADADPDNGTAWYWLGRLNLRLGDAPAAVLHFQAALKAGHPPPIPRARLLTELGAAQLQAGNAAAAQESIDKSLQLQPGDATAIYLGGMALAARGHAEQGRRQLEQGRTLDPSLPSIPDQTFLPVAGGLFANAKLPRFEARVSGDYGYDSNPGSFQDGVRVFDPQHLHRRIDGGDGVATGNLRLEAHPFYDRAGWSMGVRADAFHALHNTRDAFDLSRFAGVVQLAWGKDPLGYLNGPLGYTRVPQGDSRVSLLFQGGPSVSLLGGDGFERDYEGAASVTLREGARTASQLDFDYRDITFFNHDLFPTARDDSGHEAYVKASQYYYVGRRDRYVRVSGQLGESDRDDPAFDSHFVGTGLEFSSPLRRNLYLHSAGNWRHDDFERRSQGESHNEELIDATLALVWTVNDHLYATARSTYIDREVDPHALDKRFGFDRALGSLGVTYFY